MKSGNARQSEYAQAREQNRRTAMAVALAFIFAVGLLTALLQSGCTSPVVPQAVAASEASYDGNEQNSGIISSTPSGFVVTGHFRERHNALIAVYGGDFAPVLKPDHGIAPIGDGRWLISKQAMIDFIQMNSWRRAGLEPRTK